MKKNTLLTPIALVFILFFGVLILENLHIIPYFHTINFYIDLNNFTFRTKEYIFSIKVADKIEESKFSKELQRLDINVPNSNTLRFISGTSYILPFYRSLCADGDSTIMTDLIQLMLLFEINNTSDNERKAIIEEILPHTNKRKSNLDDIFEEIVDKHGYDWKELSIKKNKNTNQSEQ